MKEKPSNPKSNYTVTGLYFYPQGVSQKAKQVKLSARGELEITGLNKIYLNDNTLRVQLLGRDFAWLDTSTMESLIDASYFVKTVQDWQGIVISAPEEVAYYEKWITREQLLNTANFYGKLPYSAHLKLVAEDKIIF